MKPANVRISNVEVIYAFCVPLWMPLVLSTTNRTPFVPCLLLYFLILPLSPSATQNQSPLTLLSYLASSSLLSYTSFVQMRSIQWLGHKQMVPKEKLQAYQASRIIPGAGTFFIDYMDSPDRYFINAKVPTPQFLSYTSCL
jgi:hypothetical protein